MSSLGHEVGGTHSKVTGDFYPRAISATDQPPGLDFPSLLKVEMTGDFPDGPVVKNPLCNAEDKGSIPGGGTKIPHVTRQLLSPSTLESMCHNY